MKSTSCVQFVGQGDPVESDKGLSSDDGHDVDTTIEFQWIV